MIPYSDLPFFGVMLYIIVPTIVLGLFARAGWRWTLFATVAVLVAQYFGTLQITPHFDVRELWVVAGYAVFESAIVWTFLAWPRRKEVRWPFRVALALALLPLVAAKFLPLVAPATLFGFLGISYVTFRALDVVFSIHDGIITSLQPAQFFVYLFFFPTISSGPIDRYRRFQTDWQRRRTRAEFLTDLDGATQRLFRGFLYKFILAALIEKYWVDRPGSLPNALRLVSYAYGYSFYLFFDFAGYSAFAIAFSYLFGIHTPENFDRPFLARNIKDFWNRWHITLSHWFRDHIYMRFLIAATKGRWFRNKNVASSCGYFLSFGLMGLWHGTAIHYLAYGLYHGCLLTGYDAFTRWNKQRQWWGDGPAWRAANVFVTCQFVILGLLIFSGQTLSSPHHTAKLPRHHKPSRATATT